MKINCHHHHHNSPFHHLYHHYPFYYYYCDHRHRHYHNHHQYDFDGYYQKNKKNKLAFSTTTITTSIRVVILITTMKILSYIINIVNISSLADIMINDSIIIASILIPSTSSLQALVLSINTNSTTAKTNNNFLFYIVRSFGVYWEPHLLFMRLPWVGNRLNRKDCDYFVSKWKGGRTG